ncbi:hypothetical protein [Nostoc sp.]|uniref:hypothetical protein n=1 Tax=Nostoc sp. TaxID=1180 RepID=UPI002FFABD43
MTDFLCCSRRRKKNREGANFGGDPNPLLTGNTQGGRGILSSNNRNLLSSTSLYSQTQQQRHAEVVGADFNGSGVEDTQLAAAKSNTGKPQEKIEQQTQTTQQKDKGKARQQEGSQGSSNDLGESAQRQSDEQNRKKFLEDYPLAAKMLKNIDIGENEKKNLETLKKEFMNSGFVYTMNATHEDRFLNNTKKEGDCSTLARAYVKIAKEYLGIDNVKIGCKSGDFFVPNGGKVLDMNNTTGNVDNGKHWVFTKHYWVESPIGNIDLLFLGQEANKSQWIDKTGKDKEHEIDYDIFGDYRVYEANVMGKIAERYATDLNEAKKGKKAEAAAMMAVLKQK